MTHAGRAKWLQLFTARALVVGVIWLASGCQRAPQADPQVPYDRGNALLDQGKTDEAIALFREAIRLEPDFADAHYELGSALLMQKN